MARPGNTANRQVLPGVLLCLLAIPLAWSLGHAVLAGASLQGWQALLADRQTLPALGMSLWTGLASALIATLACAGLLCAYSQGPALERLVRRQGWLLAVPHAAFAVGMLLLLAPSGWLLRLLSPWATGFAAPPPWPTTQDPWGLGLIAVLALKETPFLIWAAGAYLLQPDVAQRLRGELKVAATLGYTPGSAWWRIVWPQLLPRLAAPLLAVLAYSLTVVDVAQIIGPTSPPSLALLAWQWLRDADPADNAQGAAAVWLLALVVTACAGLAWALMHAPAWRSRCTQGPDAGLLSHGAGFAARVKRSPTTVIAVGIYLAVLLALLAGSVTGPWPFPDLLPERWNAGAWTSVLASHDTLATTLWLALTSAGVALAWSVAWLELAPPTWQLRLQALAMGPLLLPALLWTLGLHQLTLAWGLDGSAAGVWLAHWLACVPYVLLTLHGPYAGFDQRLTAVAATLGHSRWHSLWRIKWPLLRASLASAFAVGFSVSVVQYLPTLYVGTGRFATVTTEAVALASGGQRNLMAAFAWLQWLLPAAVFAWAAWFGRPRRFAKPNTQLGTIRP